MGGALGGALSLGSAALDYFGAEDAGDAAMAGIREGQAITQGQLDQAIQDLLSGKEGALDAITSGYGSARDAISATGPALNLEQALTGVLGPEAQQTAFNNYAESPGQQFLRDEQEQSVLRNAAATGGLGGGAVLDELQNKAFGRASTNFQQALENVRSLRGNETNTASNMANLFTGEAGQTADINSLIAQAMANNRMQGAGMMSGLAQQAGNTNAATSLGQTRALQSGLSGLSSAAGSIPFNNMYPDASNFSRIMMGF